MYTKSVRQLFFLLIIFQTLADNLDVVSRRMGFIPLPIAVLLVRVIGPCIGISDWFIVLLLFLLFLW